VTIHIPGSVRPCKDDRDITVVSRLAHWIGMLREIGDQPDNQPLMPWRDREGSFTSLLNDPRLATDDARYDQGKRPMKIDAQGNRCILYSLRHSYAIWEAQRGREMTEASRLMGHSLPTHHQIYAHVATTKISKKRIK
jgi:integrase